jgi:hypothetical protein
MTLEALVIAVVAMSFNLPSEQARVHVEAAMTAAHAYHQQMHVDEDRATELLLGMAYIESRYDELSLSRRECAHGQCVRVAAHWDGATPPPHARPSWYCGALQAGGNVSWETCQRMRTDVAAGYDAGARELVIWLNDPNCAQLTDDDRLVCALHGYGGGYSAIEAGTSRYPMNVLWAARRIQQFARGAEKRLREPRS